MSNTATAIFDCDNKRPSLPRNFKGIVSTPSDVKTYNVKRWAPNAMKQAAYVVCPTDATDISAAILFAREEKLPLAISGGRHDIGGASSTEGGVVIDMRKMNAVRVDKENKIGYIEGGTTVHQAVRELFKHGMATVTGHCGTTGVAGLSCGGGIGFKMGEHGLACDNIVSAKVVLASGIIVIANDQENADLLWGIKGGGSNFGVVAELGMRLHEARPNLHTGLYIYLPEQLPQLVAELSAWLKVQTPREGLGLVFDLGPDDGKPYLILHCIAELDPEEGDRLWSRFHKLDPILSRTRQIPYDAYISLGDGFDAMPGNKIQCGAHFNAFDYETVKKSYDMWLAITPKAPMSSLMYEFYSYDLASTVPAGATAFPHRTKLDKVALIGLYGFEDAWMAEALKVSKDIQACISSSSTESARNSIGYLNYASMDASQNDTDEKARKAFGPNYPRLQRLKRKYDPDMVFNKWFCIRPTVM
ncbi:hypothetical protein FRB94_008343 [Tulasnella sp. JGI-2019a]|nr:hypothetical protein FRB93_002342 [Tulasnella sp. JGI-2019a]KAG8996427.1 hypothetical protein FRB94_008343 [Tulasnella sp. JGI-2019a]